MRYVWIALLLWLVGLFIATVVSVFDKGLTAFNVVLGTVLVVGIGLVGDHLAKIYRRSSQ